ncbi:terminase small subunit [Serratia marcescens]
MLFYQKYLIDLNVTQAATSARYSVKITNRIASN